MIFAHQIRSVVEQYISGALDAKGFVQGFSALSHNIHKDGEAEAVRLANVVEAYLADARSGCISNAVLRSRLRDLVSIGNVNCLVAQPSFPTAVNQYQGAAFPAADPVSAPSGTSLAAGFWSPT